MTAPHRYAQKSNINTKYVYGRSRGLVRAHADGFLVGGSGRLQCDRVGMGEASEVGRGPVAGPGARRRR